MSLGDDLKRVGESFNVQCPIELDENRDIESNLVFDIRRQKPETGLAERHLHSSFGTIHNLGKCVGDRRQRSTVKVFLRRRQTSRTVGSGVSLIQRGRTEHLFCRLRRRKLRGGILH